MWDGVGWPGHGRLWLAQPLVDSRRCLSRPEVKRTLLHCGCVDEDSQIVDDIVPEQMHSICLCER